MDKTIEFVFAEFNSKNELAPALNNIRKFFPNASVKLYTDGLGLSDVCHKDHPRYGYRMHDYYLMKGILDSTADIAIGIDADMRIVSDDVNALIPLTEKFGLCLVANPRMLVRIDTLVGADSDKQLDVTHGAAYALNSALIACNAKNEKAKSVIEEACLMFLENPLRSPLVLWRAIWKTVSIRVFYRKTGAYAREMKESETKLFCT
jgi:hypothetical protein